MKAAGLRQECQPARNFGLCSDDVRQVRDHEDVLETAVPHFTDLFALCCTCSDGDASNRVQQVASDDLVALDLAGQDITHVAQDSAQLALDLVERLCERSEIWYDLTWLWLLTSCRLLLAGGSLGSQQRQGGALCSRGEECDAEGNKDGVASLWCQAHWRRNVCSHAKRLIGAGGRRSGGRRAQVGVDGQVHCLVGR